MAQVRLRNADGFELGAVFYDAQRPRSPRRVALLHGGGGIASLRYGRFAQFLAEWGIPVLTYDYRGIGLSRPAQLTGFGASTVDWVEYDSAAAIDWLRSRFPHDELIGMSHSIGALALAAAPNAASQDRLVFIAPHTAYVGDYRLAYRLPMALLWHGVMPLMVRALGYFPARRLRLGEDLPAGIALEWARRRAPDLTLIGQPELDQRARRLLSAAATLERPALAVTISDDAFATAAGAKRMLSYFPRLELKRMELTPAEASVASLGHFGLFRRQAGPVLWPRLLAAAAGRQD